MARPRDYGRIGRIAVGPIHREDIQAGASRRGISAGALYRYFPSKVHLLGCSLTRKFGVDLPQLQLCGHRR
ncbi:TetR family transcriptional regulator [Mycolicibacterium gadium]|uniref:TetR family transcriptional regulator n=1 Tax=Mycolicibacterium gadium TaxID=1794 RepID=UPI001D42E582|nr:TetR family transcriptional regulator [Mycobacteriaceae bacterium]